MYINIYISLVVCDWLKIPFGAKSIGKYDVKYILQNPLYLLNKKYWYQIYHTVWYTNVKKKKTISKKFNDNILEEIQEKIFL